MPLLDIADLTKVYDTGGLVKYALRCFSLKVERGEFLSVVGRSGSGKTTLLRLISGLTEPNCGEIRTDACERLRIAAVFQEPRLMPWLTVRENITFSDLGGDGALGRHREWSIEEMLSMLGLEKYGGAYPRELSGGMAQRVSLGRALWGSPELVLMDEPTSSLDYFTKINLRDEIARIHEKRGDTIIMVTHDVEEAVFMSDRVIVLEDGTIAGTYCIDAERPRSRSDLGLAEVAESIIDMIVKG